MTRWPAGRGVRTAAVLAAMLVFVLLLGCRGTSSAAPVIVVLDPGHGGDEPGATGFGIVERDSNLDMALRVRALLVAAGMQVELTRATSGRSNTIDTSEMNEATATFLDLQSRIAKANAAGADVFVSLHSNAFPDAEVRGLEAWHDSGRPFAGQNRLLAQLLDAHVRRALAAIGYPDLPGLVSDDAGLLDEHGRAAPYLAAPSAICSSMSWRSASWTSVRSASERVRPPFGRERPRSRARCWSSSTSPTRKMPRCSGTRRRGPPWHAASPKGSSTS